MEAQLVVGAAAGGEGAEGDLMIFSVGQIDEAEVADAVAPESLLFAGQGFDGVAPGRDGIFGNIVDGFQDAAL